MKNIRIDTESLGGLAYIYAMPPECILRVRVDYNTNELWPEFLLRDHIIRLPVMESSPQEFKFSEVHEWAESGDIYTVSITGYIPRTKELTDEVIHQLEKGRWVVLHIDRNGTAYLSGTDDVPLKFTRKRDTGDTPAARNTVGFTFSAVEAEPSLRVRVADFDWL